MHLVCQLSLQGKRVFHEKKWLVQLATKTATPMLLLKTSLIVYMRANAFCVSALSLHRMKQWIEFKSWNITELRFFLTAFIVDILELNWLCLLLCFNACAWQWSAQWWLIQFGAMVLIYTKAVTILPSVLSYHLCKYPYSKKGNEHLSVIMKIILPSQIPGSFSGTLGVHELTRRATALRRATTVGILHLVTCFT